MNEMDSAAPVHEKAKAHLEKMLELLEIQGAVSEETIDGSTVCYRINCSDDDAKFLIGRKGQTLDALQILLRQMVKGPDREEEHFIVDVLDYRQRRKDSIVERTKYGAVAVLNGETEEFDLPPMSAFERRIVHNYLHEQFPDLATESRGQDPDRHIVISYRGISEEIESKREANSSEAKSED